MFLPGGRALWPYDPRPLTSRQLLAVVAVLLLAVGYRCASLGSNPRPFATKDEYHYLWAGLSLLEGGEPVSWSYLSCYVAPDSFLGSIDYEDHEFALVRPALDHPPLFSLLAGAYARISGALEGKLAASTGRKTLPVFDVNLTRARTLPLLLSVLTLLLLFELGRRSFGFVCGLVAMALYGVLAHAVLHNRLVVTENFTVPLFLLTLWALQRHLGGRMSACRFGFLASLATTAAVLCKVAALCQAGAVVLLLLRAAKPRLASGVAASGAAGLLLYAAFGMWQGWDIFMGVLECQAFRFQSPYFWPDLLAAPKLVHTPTPQHLLTLGWIALLGLLLIGRAPDLLLAPVVYLACYGFFVPTGDVLGWHLLPYDPFLCLAAAAVLQRVVADSSGRSWIALLALLLPYALFSLFRAVPHSESLSRLLYLITLGAAFGIAFARPRCGRHFKLAALAILLGISGWNEILIAREYGKIPVPLPMGKTPRDLTAPTP